VEVRNPGSIGTPNGADTEHLLQLGLLRFEGSLVLAVVGAKLRMAKSSWFVVVPEDTCRTDRIRKIPEQSVIARVTDEAFNVPAARSH
jgi:hypothetical protein